MCNLVQDGIVAVGQRRQLDERCFLRPAVVHKAVAERSQPRHIDIQDVLALFGVPPNHSIVFVRKGNVHGHEIV